MNWIITDDQGQVITASSTARQLVKSDFPENIRTLCSDCPNLGQSNILHQKILNLAGLQYQPSLYEDEGRVRILWQTVETDTIARLEKLLSGERQFFDLVFNNVDADIAIFDTDHRYRYVNRKGIKDEELRKWIIGKDDFDYCSYRKKPASEAFDRRKKFNEALGHQKTVHWTDHYMLTDGSEQFVQRTFNPILIGGEVKYIVGIGRDVTTYELLNRELLKNKEKYERLFHENIAGLFKSDLKGNFLEMNTAFAETFGYTVKELMQLPASVLYTSQQHREEYLENLKRLGSLTNYSLYLKNKSGDQVTILANINLTPGDTAGEGTIQGALLDVTEEREAYKTINWLSSIPKESPDPIVRLDGISGKVLFMNLSAEEAFEGLDYEEILGQMFRDSLANSGDKSEHVMEIGDCWYLIRCAKIRADRPYINFYFSDITEEKLMIKELDRSIKELNQRNENLRQFNFIVSHNLRAPISNLRGLTALTQTKFKNLPDELSDVISHIGRSSSQLDQVIIDLNHLLEVQSIKETAEEFKVSDSVQNVLKMLSKEIDESRATVRVSCDKLLTFFSIQSFVHSVLYNLVSNSLKYRSPDRPVEIDIRCHCFDDILNLEVVDNGLGFDEKANMVFQPFKRHHLHVEGKGLGLSIVKAQVEQLGGTIKVASSVDVGSSFYVSIPTWN